MKFVTAVTLALSTLSATLAQRPSNVSICDYYTSALLGSVTAENEYTLLKLLVNTVVIGNYTKTPAPMNAVPGILAAGTYNNGTANVSVNLAPFFSGTSGATTNRNGTATAGVNFLDGGGATPLLNNSLPTAGSNEYTLLTHLYEYFGVLLGCTAQGQSAFPAYAGSPSQYNVHKYMDLTPTQVGWFIQQVALAASSFGVATADIQAVGTSLNSVFNVRCGPPTSIPSTDAPSLQSICIDVNCPLAVNASCAAYAQNQTSSQGPNGTVVGPGNSGNGSTRASGTAASGSASSASGAGASSSSSTAKSAGEKVVVGGALGLVAFAAALL